MLLFCILLIVSQTFGSDLSKLCRGYKRSASYRLLADPEECGKIRLVNKVMGGEDATLGEFPFLAIILLKKGRNVKTLCGGSIINDRYILTAAHCFGEDYETLLSKGFTLYVRLGEHDLRQEIDCDDSTNKFCAPKPIEIQVKKIVLHEKVNLNIPIHDIALLRLKKKIVYNDYVSPVCLPLDCVFVKENLVGQKMTVAGWGNMVDGKNPKKGAILQKVDLHISSNDGCSEDWRKDILETHICAGGTREHNEAKKIKDACKGDSGGPLFYPTKLGGSYIRYVQVAVVSGGDGCDPTATEVSAGLYTRVTAYIPWILKHVKK